MRAESARRPTLHGTPVVARFSLPRPVPRSRSQISCSSQLTCCSVVSYEISEAAVPVVYISSLLSCRSQVRCSSEQFMDHVQ